MSRSRNYCFTLNNYSDDHVNEIASWDCKYVVFGKEEGKEGTPHLQGYVEFKNAKTLKSLKKLNKAIHWEARKGTAKQAADYCKKDGDFMEHGTMSAQGKRTDLDNVAAAVIEGVPLNEIAAENPAMWIRYNKGLTSLKNELTKHRTGPAEVMWLYGGTGVGKTRYAVESSDSYYIKDGTRWWNAYAQEETIIIDDFDGSWNFRDLLRLLDRYPYQGETKGGYVKINSARIIITAEFAPDYWYSGTLLEQVLRRIGTVKEILKGSGGGHI